MESFRVGGCVHLNSKRLGLGIDATTFIMIYLDSRVVKNVLLLTYTATADDVTLRQTFYILLCSDSAAFLSVRIKMSTCRGIFF